MSNLADKTEKAAIQKLANTLKEFDKLSGLNMTSEDAFEARQAENLIRGIIETNGYSISYKPGKGTIIKKNR